MSTEDLEKYETEMELQLYREYRDIVRQPTPSTCRSARPGERSTSS
jgi:hypothetical protein